MKPSDFKYFKANSLDHALDILNSEENIKIIAGGQSLVPLMNFRLGQPGKKPLNMYWVKAKGHIGIKEKQNIIAVDWRTYIKE